MDKLETQTEKERIGPTLERPDGEGNGNSSNNGYNGSDADLLNPDTSQTWQETIQDQSKDDTIIGMRSTDFPSSNSHDSGK